jgi:hypothetical protein
MQGSVIWATVISLLLGCVVGVAAMGGLLLPIQYKLEQEQLASKQQLIEMENERNDALQQLEDARAKQMRAVQMQQQTAKEKKQLELQYADAVHKLAETQQQLLKKKP